LTTLSMFPCGPFLFVAVLVLATAPVTSGLQRNRYVLYNTNNSATGDMVTEVFACADTELTQLKNACRRGVVANWVSPHKGITCGSQVLTNYACKQRGKWTPATGLRNALKNLGMRIQITCADEHNIRTAVLAYLQQPILGRLPAGVSRNGSSLAPKMIRMVFHDALDYTNLQDKSGAEVNSKGGVDYCLHLGTKESPDIEDNDVVGDPSHNKGLSRAFQMLRTIGRRFRNLISMPDLEVLAAIVSMEVMGSKTIEYSYGRELNPQCGASKKNNFLKLSPSKDWGGGSNQELFAKLGFSPKDQVALMGAHSIGGVQPCTGSGNLGNAPMCPQSFEQQLGKEGADACMTLINKRRPADCLGRGIYFDHTPDKLDNDYYKVLQSAGTARRPNCRSLMERGTHSTEPCEPGNEWCNGTNTVRGNTPFETSTRNFTKAFSLDRKLAHFGSETELLKDPSTAPSVAEFASNPSNFYSAFASAFATVTNIGWTRDELYQCEPSPCAVKNGELLCGVAASVSSRSTDDEARLREDTGDEEEEEVLDAEEGEVTDNTQVSVPTSHCSVPPEQIAQASSCVLESVSAESSFTCTGAGTFTCSQPSQFSFRGSYNVEAIEEQQLAEDAARASHDGEIDSDTGPKPEVIAVAVVGCVAFVGLVVGGVFYVRHRKSKGDPLDAPSITLTTLG